MWGAVLSAGASLIGGSMQADSAENAANAQAGASAAAVGESRRQFNLGRSDLAPFRKSGVDALTALRSGLGILRAPTWEEAKEARDAAHFKAYNQGLTPEELNNRESGDKLYFDILNQQYERDKAEFGSGMGGLTRKFSVDDFTNDPVIQKSFEFGLSEGEKAVRRMFGAKGMSRSGAAVKAMTRFAGDYTGQQAGASRQRFVEDQNNLFNKYASVAGIGQAATTATASMGANTATNIGNLLVGEGNARGAAAIASGNAWAGALNNVGNTIGDAFGMSRRSGGVPSWSTPPYIPQVMGSVPGQFNLDTYG